MHYKDEQLIDDCHHLFNTPANSWIVEPNIAVQYSRPYFFPSQCKRKKMVWLRETTQQCNYMCIKLGQFVEIQIKNSLVIKSYNQHLITQLKSSKSLLLLKFLIIITRLQILFCYLNVAGLIILIIYLRLQYSQ